MEPTIAFFLGLTIPLIGIGIFNTVQKKSINRQVVSIVVVALLSLLFVLPSIALQLLWLVLLVISFWEYRKTTQIPTLINAFLLLGFLIFYQVNISSLVLVGLCLLSVAWAAISFQWPTAKFFFK